MGVVLTEGRVEFTFDDGLEVARYDEWQHHREWLQRAPGRGKAVDFVAATTHTLTLIEVKDYREADVENPPPSDLPTVIAAKVYDTIASLRLASRSAYKASEKAFATRTASANAIVVIAHVDQRRTRSRLRPALIDAVALRAALKRELKFLKDYSAYVTSVDDPVDQQPYRSSSTSA